MSSQKISFAIISLFVVFAILSQSVMASGFFPINLAGWITAMDMRVLTGLAALFHTNATSTVSVTVEQAGSSDPLPQVLLIPDATVVMKNVKTEATTSGRTIGSGVAIFNVPYGIYTVTANAAGYYSNQIGLYVKQPRVSVFIHLSLARSGYYTPEPIWGVPITGLVAVTSTNLVATTAPTST